MSAVQPIDPELLRGMPLPWPGENTDKDSRGRVLVAGGSRLSAGAVPLSGLAALRAGAGKLMLAVPKVLAVPIGVSFPEAGVSSFSVSGKGHPTRRAAPEISALASQADALLLGPGLADEPAAQQLAHLVLQANIDTSFVIDAMCITGLWDQQSAVARYENKMVITPHPGEMAALTGLSKEEVCAEPVRVAEYTARRLKCIVVLKGSVTVIAQPDGPTYRYDGGGVGLATSGSGDVLAGVMAGLIARGAAPLEAAAWSVYLHGEAGRRLANRIGPLGYLASELPAEIPALLWELGPNRTP